MNKPILCLDFDGVIHSYTSGWKGADIIPDPPVPGAMEFIYGALRDFTVAIYSSRSNQADGMNAMQEYVAEHLQSYFDGQPEPFRNSLGAQLVTDVIQWPTEKPAAFVTIDDRAITFMGLWPSMETLKAFKPWNKGGGFDWGALQALRKASP